MMVIGRMGRRISVSRAVRWATVIHLVVGATAVLLGGRTFSA